MLFFVVLSFSLTSVFTTKSSDATNGKVVRGRFCNDQKPVTFNQPWTTEEQVHVCVDSPKGEGLILEWSTPGWVGGGGLSGGVFPKTLILFQTKLYDLFLSYLKPKLLFSK